MVLQLVLLINHMVLSIKLLMRNKQAHIIGLALQYSWTQLQRSSHKTSAILLQTIIDIHDFISLVYCIV